MAGNIRISPEQMRSRAAEYRMEACNVESVIARMDSLLTALESEWEGDASQAYTARYMELKPKFQAAKDLIDEIAMSLDNTANAMEEMDAAIAGGFRM